MVVSASAFRPSSHQASPASRTHDNGSWSHLGHRAAGSPFQASALVRPAEAFAVHDQVTHDAYGLGVILGIEDDAVLVDFRPQQRRILLPCAKLTKL